MVRTKVFLALFAVAICASFPFAAPARAADVNLVTIVSGNNQTAPHHEDSQLQALGGVSTFKPLVVLVTDLAKKPVAGVRVTFTCKSPAGMTCRLTTEGAKSVVAVSDALGQAKLNAFAGTAAAVFGDYGAFTITATGPTFTAVPFTLVSSAAVAK